MNYKSFKTIRHAQINFDKWRYIYNTERPHEAIGMMPPIKRYKVSERIYPGKLPPIEYMTSDEVRKVDYNGKISYQQHVIRVGKALRGENVAIRQAEEDGIIHIFFCQQMVKKFDLREQ